MRETIRKGVLTTTAAVTMVGVFAPWLRSGENGRSSFELFDLVDRLGFSPDGPFAVVLQVWPGVPLALVVSVVAIWAGRVRTATGFGVGVGCYVALVALGVMGAPDAGLVSIEWGVGVALVGGLTHATASIWVLSGARSIAAGPHATLDVDRFE